MTFFLQNLVNALQWGSFYALIALGYSMVYSILMLFNFAHGDIFMVGAYIGFGVATGLTALASAQLDHPGVDHSYFHVPHVLCRCGRGKTRIQAVA
jgi:branched-subunit amino acid ABC-type transport system permease component